MRRYNSWTFVTRDSQSDPFRRWARQMVASQLQPRGIRDERLLDAMRRVPRHAFVPSGDMAEAYDDRPVAIGEDQTISQPYIVASMLQALQLQPSDKVLEVGTGSGYQTALLAELAAMVYSVERFASLAEQARRTLERLGYTNLRIEVGDGSEGLPAYAPFGRIVVSAAAPQVPEPLVTQLAEGGRMVIPVGTRNSQELFLLQKIHGHLLTGIIEGCRFVPLVGAHGFGAE